MRLFPIFVVLVSQMTIPSFSQQAASTAQPATVSCTFDDGKQMKVQYNKSPAKREEELQQGKLWEPGGSPMILFTQTVLSLGNSQIPAGAYSLYVIPEKENWTLVVNKNVAAGSKYDEKQDLVRAPMQVGEIGNPVEGTKVAFAHVAPKQCNMRLYHEKAGAFAEFHER
jgi:hypothetical protein